MSIESLSRRARRATLAISCLAGAALLAQCKPEGADGSPEVLGRIQASLYAPPSACTYFIAPAGNDANACTSSSAPCKTWTHVLPMLRPGNTLCVEAGATPYTVASNGWFNADCSATGATSSVSGTAAGHITVRAWSPTGTGERDPILQADVGINWAVMAVRLNQCRFWDLWGLSVKGKDAPYSAASPPPAGSASGADALVELLNTSAVTVRRFQVQNSNRCMANDRLLWVMASSDVLLEENELYNFSDHAINVEDSSQVTVRRNYVNTNYFPVPTPASCNCTMDGSSGYACPWAPCATDYSSCGWTTGIVLYVSSGTTVENNVVEYSGAGYEAIHLKVGTVSSGSHNKLLGNIALDNYDGIALANRGSEYGGDDGMRDFVVEDHLSINSPNAPNPINRHLWITPLASIPELRVSKSSFFDTDGRSPSVAWIAEFPNGEDAMPDSSLSIRSLLMMTSATAAAPAINFGATTWGSCDVTNSAFFGAGALPSTCATSQLTTADPNVPAPSGSGRCKVGAGGCLAFTACDPNLHRSPTSGTVLGETIGANLIYRYENGTIRPARFEGGAAIPNWLWDPTSTDGTGAFPCGKDVTATLATFQEVAAARQRSCRTFPKLDLAINSAQCPHPSNFY
jgi:hypothetical protein